MNKLRLIRIFELRGKIHPIEQFIIDLLDGIEQVPYSNVYIRYMKADTFYFVYYPKSNHISLSYDLYKEYKTKFGCSKEETLEIMKYLLEKHLKIEIKEVN